MIKLLAVDMDGTCLDPKGKMSDETVTALKKAAAAGILVVPTTGRNINCLPEKIKDEIFYRYAITTNGALVLDLEKNEEIFSAYLDNKDIADILCELKKYPILTALNLNRHYCAKGIILYFGIKHVLGKDARKLQVVPSAIGITKKKNTLIEDIQLFYHNDKYSDIIRQAVSKHEGICVTFARKYAEIYSSKGTKGNALLALGKHLGISADEIACIGDEANDVSMFNVVGKSFAMGNAIEALKEIADVILPSNDENGVAYAIDRYILDGGNV